MTTRHNLYTECDDSETFALPLRDPLLPLSKMMPLPFCTYSIYQGTVWGKLRIFWDFPEGAAPAEDRTQRSGRPFPFFLLPFSRQLRYRFERITRCFSQETSNKMRTTC